MLGYATRTWPCAGGCGKCVSTGRFGVLAPIPPPSQNRAQGKLVRSFCMGFSQLSPVLSPLRCGEGKYRRINAPKGSPPGTPPVQRGRPLSEFCGKVKQVRVHCRRNSRVHGLRMNGLREDG